MPPKRSAMKSAIMKEAAKRQKTERARFRRAIVPIFLKRTEKLTDSDRKMFIHSQ